MGIIFSSFNGLEPFPKLRFLEFKNTYKKIKLNKAVERIQRKDPTSEAPVMMLSAASGFIMQSEKYSRENAGQSLKKYILLKKGELAYNHGASKYKPFGCCFELKEEEARIPYVYHCFAVKENNDKSYIARLLNNQKIDQQLKRLISSSVRMDGLLNISYEEYTGIDLYLPSLPEQQKIADFLSLVDQRIEKQRQLVESLKKYKRGLLSAIFDHKLRFKDENGNDYPEWDNFVLDNLGSFYNGLSGKNKDDFGTGNSEYITYMNVFKNTIANETICERVNILPNEHQNIVNFGDLLFTQSSETMEEVGFCSVWNSHKKVFLNSFCFGLHFNNSKFAYPQFMAHYMRSYKIRLLIMRESQGATRINLSSERLKKIELSLPPYKEQKIIAHFIERYDNTIQNEEKKLEMFNNLKQGLLQQMFI